MDSATEFKPLSKTICISHTANTFGKGMNESSYSPSSDGSVVGKTGLFNLDMATCLEEKTEFKTNWPG